VPDAFVSGLQQEFPPISPFFCQLSLATFPHFVRNLSPRFFQDDPQRLGKAKDEKNPKD
jgi:hypothetical protein